MIKGEKLEGLFPYFLFFKLCFIDYAIEVVLILPSWSLSSQQPPLPQAILPTIVHVHGSCV